MPSFGIWKRISQKTGNPWYSGSAIIDNENYWIAVFDNKDNMCLKLTHKENRSNQMTIYLKSKISKDGENYYGGKLETEKDVYWLGLFKTESTNPRYPVYNLSINSENEDESNTGNESVDDYMQKNHSLSTEIDINSDDF